MTKNPYLKAYTQHKSNAKTRGIEMLLTFEEWKAIWINSGKWEQRGKGSNKYCMCRVNDAGHYSLGNVFIDLNKNNVSFGNKGKPKSIETKKKMSESAVGKVHEWSICLNNVMHKKDVKEKFSLATRGEKHYNQKGVVSPFGYFVTTKEAAKELGIPKQTIEWRCRNNKSGFKYAIA